MGLKLQSCTVIFHRSSAELAVGPSVVRAAMDLTFTPTTDERSDQHDGPATDLLKGRGTGGGQCDFSCEIFFSFRFRFRFS